MNMETSKDPSVLTNDERNVYIYALKDEFNSMGIDAKKQHYYIDKIINTTPDNIVYLRRFGAIAVSREIMTPGNVFGA
ncbi:hypothetical protein [Kurthia huakuii]|uniref:hypothetical protein n=1 Tax=Kurthia huakuii TaxID=1421019 RepID=UPI0004962F32|nr:hypothetical protein [Kurthia huakuii]MBM7699308.1 hypothetical protein [Kurthia huakuii]